MAAKERCLLQLSDTGMGQAARKSLYLATEEGGASFGQNGDRIIARFRQASGFVLKGIAFVCTLRSPEQAFEIFCIKDSKGEREAF